MAKLDPATGPIPRDKFYALVSAPAGAAKKFIRKYDPFFGRAPGEKVRWLVTYTKEVEGYAYVEAESKEEATKLGKNLRDDEVEYDTHDDGCRGDFISVEVDDQR